MAAHKYRPDVCDIKMPRLPVARVSGIVMTKALLSAGIKTGSVSLLASGNGRVCLGVGTYHVAHDVLRRASLIQI
jgi:hypothetical protein